jgi:capsular polysaccharide transport system permease protein
LLAVILTIWLTASRLGLLFALAICYVPEVDKIRSLITRPLFFISGIFFSLNDIPREYWPYLTWNPLLHAVELARGAAYPFYNTSGVSALFLVIFTLITVSLSLSCYHIIWKQAISR